MRSHGVDIHLAGGETADVGDVVRTIDVGYTAFARMRRSDLIINNIQPGDVIVGLASYGQTVYENTYNGGMGSNGLTSARHDVLRHEYAAKYPESFDPNLPAEVVYTGNRSLTELIDIPKVPGLQVPVGKLLLSPTRTYLPILKAILGKYRKRINGLIHCTGGGQTKVMKFAENVHIIKNNLFEVPPLFQLIHDASGTDWREMYQVFNMGHRMELYVPGRYAKQIVAMAQSFGVEAQVIGRVEAGTGTQVTVASDKGTFVFE
jgi:phosphoribosylformylglycinamidine cyclo-ligase